MRNPYTTVDRMLNKKDVRRENMTRNRFDDNGLRYADTVDIFDLVITMGNYIDRVYSASKLIDAMINYDNYNSSLNTLHNISSDREQSDYDEILRNYSRDYREIRQLEPRVKNALNTVPKITVNDKFAALTFSSKLQQHEYSLQEINRTIPIPEIIDYMYSDDDYKVLRQKHGLFIDLLSKLFLQLQAFTKHSVKPPISYRRADTTTSRRAANKNNKPIIRKSTGKKTNRATGKPRNLSFMDRVKAVSGIKLKK